MTPCWRKKLTAKDVIRRTAGSARLTGLKARRSVASASAITTKQTPPISKGAGQAPISSVEVAALVGTTSEKAPTMMKSPWAKLISRMTPKMRPMPSAVRA
jgi:hypothetical protein